MTPEQRDRVLAALGLVDRHLAGLHDQMTHGHGGAVHALAEALKKLLPDGQDDDSLYLDPDAAEGGRYFDWATRRKNGLYGWEIGNEADGETVGFDLHEEEMRQLASALSVTLMRDRAPAPDPSDPNSLLLSSLLHAGQHGNVAFGDDPDVAEQDRYFDWSSRGDGGAYRLEVGADGEAVIVELSPDEMAQLHAQLTRTLLRAQPPPSAERAAGKDVTPGHDELHHYWTRGEGLARWAESPKPWTTLVAHLSKIPEIGPRKAKIYASRWFIEVFGYAAGSDKNRVAHGKPPRGKRVGPG